LIYKKAPDVKLLVDEIIEKLNFSYIIPECVHCFRSEGSKSRRIIARIHGFGKIWQQALDVPPTYIIEVLSERYDRLSEEEKVKTVIHELMHIPMGFKGGFRPHKGYVSKHQVEEMHKKYRRKTSEHSI
jgi:predicted metallopeptidase